MRTAPPGEVDIAQASLRPEDDARLEHNPTEAVLTGERYKASVPDTLDLAARMALSINALTNQFVPSERWALAFTVNYSRRPPVLFVNHSTDAWLNIPAKFIEALVNSRLASGSDGNLAADRKIIATQLGIIGEDGLSYAPEEPLSNMEGERNYSEIWGEGRLLLALSMLAQVDDDPRWIEIGKKKADRLLALTKEKDGYRYVWKGRFHPDDAPPADATEPTGMNSPILNLEAKDEFPTPVRDLARDLLSRLSAKHRDQRPFQPDLDARIASYELAARLQLSATDALDVSQESEATREMYGINKKVSSSYGRRCLMARRLVERGVRYVQIYIEQQIWDNHSGLEKNLRYCCNKTDQPVGALIKDLKQRGLLEDTLLVWGGEFGRLPLSQGGDGRDHGPAGFTTWMAGGGIKGGIAYGNTDDTGYKAVENRVSVHDFHATILHSLGLDFKKLIYNHNGLDEKPTGQEPARVVKEILA